MTGMRVAVELGAGAVLGIVGDGADHEGVAGVLGCGSSCGCDRDRANCCCCCCCCCCCELLVARAPTV